MCGRYVFVPTEGWKYNTVEQKPSSFEPNYNVAPTQTMPIVTTNGIEMMKWGLVPSWAKEFKASFTSINARAETAAEKPLYRVPFQTRRCLVPASGFYEWQQLGTYKQPYLFTVPGRDIFHFAGLYDIWFDKADQPHYSYTILTTTANETMSGVHDRMPVILDDDEEQHWLEPEADEDVQLILNPFDGVMNRHQVSREVGNIKNNHAGLLLEINSA